MFLFVRRCADHVSIRQLRADELQLPKRQILCLLYEERPLKSLFNTPTERLNGALQVLTVNGFRKWVSFLLVCCHFHIVHTSTPALQENRPRTLCRIKFADCFAPSSFTSLY